MATVCNRAAMTQALVDKMRARQELPPPAVRRTLREAAGLSREDIAREVGCSRQAVLHWESGRCSPRGPLLVAYVDVLKAIRERL